jgi:glycosyl-4,4'-diaponeurosporenoate acyltransferase
MIPLVHVSVGVAVALDAAAWASWSFVVGLVGARLTSSAMAHDTWLTRTRRFERDAQCYEAVGMRRWKDSLPEFGAFAGGRSKRHLPGRDSDSLATFAGEARRAEYVHWAIIAALPAFAIWNPAPLFAAMAAYAVAANVPCIAIQRYNRARIGRIERRAFTRHGAQA